MSNKIVYSLCSRGCDHYSVMTRISLLSVRICNPRIDISLLLDRQSYDLMKSLDDPLLIEVDRLILCDVPDGGGAYRSRYLKTYARKAIVGAFLMLDSDILVREDLEEIFMLKCDLAGAPNHSKDDYKDQLWDEDLKSVNIMRWKLRSDIYVNTGVLFFGDTDGSRIFGNKWHEYWRLSYHTTGRHQDQPAFNAALRAEDVLFLRLDHRYNLQVKMNSEMAHRAAVWHLYSSVNVDIENVFDLLVRDVVAGKKLNRAQVEDIILQGRLYADRRNWKRAFSNVIRRIALPVYHSKW